MDEETANRVYRTYNQVYKTGKPNKSIVFEIIRNNVKNAIVYPAVWLYNY